MEAHQAIPAGLFEGGCVAAWLPSLPLKFWPAHSGYGYPDGMLQGVVTGCFAVKDRGTFITFRIVSGSYQRGDVLTVETRPTPLIVTVRAVEHVDCDIGRPTARAEPVLRVDGVDPKNVPAGILVHS